MISLPVLGIDQFVVPLHTHLFIMRNWLVVAHT